MMELRQRLAALALAVADEAERNSAFRRRLEEAFRPLQAELPMARDGKQASQKDGDARPRDADPNKKGGRRTPSVVDPIELARQGEDTLRHKLAALDIEQLKDVVAQHGMDPGKLVMKWKDPARIVDRIVELSMARSTKGDAFRADKPVVGSATEKAEEPSSS